MVEISGGRSGSAGRGRRTTSFPARLATNEPATVAPARSHSARRSSSSAAPAAAIASHSAPCSPSFEYAFIARSTPGWWPRVRRKRSAAVSALEADAPGLGVEPHVDDLREVERDAGVLGLQLVPALLTAHRALQRVIGLLLEPQADHAARVEADVHTPELVALGCHQCAGSTISVSTPPVDLGCRKATRELRMPRRGCLSISWSPAWRTAPSAWSMSSQA